MGGPLDGVEVLDIGTQTPGKYCTFLLAELGARVLRVERPAGRGGPLSTEDLHLNRGKRSMTLDLRREEARAILYRLVERADVLLESHRPGVAGRLGLAGEALLQRNPRLVCCSLSGFGQQGPRREQPAYDLTLLGLSGMLSAFLGEGVPPRPPGVFVADAVSGLVAALGISLALLERERSGRGRHLDIAMLDAVLSLLSVSHGVRLEGGATPAPPSASPLYDVYEAADGRWVTLAAIRPSSCRALLEELGRPELAERPTSGELATFLRETFRSAPAASWIERLGRLDVEIGPVRTPAEAFDDAQLATRRMVSEATHPEFGDHLQLGSPLARTLAEAGTAPAPAPAVGADTERVLAELGLEEDEIARLRAAGSL